MHSKKIERLLNTNKTAAQGGGQDRISSQHDKGKLTARERIDLLLDEGSFTEIDALTTHHYHEFDMQKKKFFGECSLVETCEPTPNGSKKNYKTYGSCHSKWLPHSWYNGFRRCKNSRRNFELGWVC